MNHNYACTNLSGIYSRGLGVPIDFKIAKKYAIKACTLNDSKACANLGSWYFNSKKVISHKEAIKYSKKACELNNSGGCVTLGNIYAKVDKDILMAKKYYLTACDLNDASACKNLGILYAQDYQYLVSVKASPILIKNSSEGIGYYLKKSCSLGNNSACEMLR